MNDVQQLISEGSIEEAMDVLTKFVLNSVDDNERLNELIMIKFRWNRNESFYERAAIDRESYDIGVNRIVRDLLIFSQEIFSSFPQKQSDTFAEIKNSSVNNSTYQSRIFLSYNRASDKSEVIADKIYQDLKLNGYNVWRGERASDRKNISTFLSNIDKSDLLVLILNEDYFYSEEAMSEFSEIAQYADFERSRFTGRILPIVLDEINLRDPELLDRSKRHWKDAYYTTNSRESRRIYRNLDQILHWIANIYERIPKTDLQPIKERIEEQLRAA
ncbi:MAG: TIR domain-containing protein [Bacteroidota bacterium]